MPRIRFFLVLSIRLSHSYGHARHQQLTRLLFLTIPAAKNVKNTTFIQQMKISPLKYVTIINEQYG